MHLEAIYNLLIWVFRNFLNDRHLECKEKRSMNEISHILRADFTKYQNRRHNDDNDNEWSMIFKLFYPIF